MPMIDFPIFALRLEGDGGLWLGEALGLPALSRLARGKDRLDKRLVENIAELLPKLDPIELHRLAAPVEPAFTSIELEMPAPPRLPHWRDPLKLAFATIRWQRGPDAHLAFVPALGLQVAANRAEDLDKQLPREIQ